jgi:hypothetical protein
MILPCPENNDWRLGNIRWGCATSGSKSLAQDGPATVSNGSFSGTLDAQSVSTWTGNLTGVATVNSNAGKTAGLVSIPAESSSNYDVYDLNGKRASGTHLCRLTRQQLSAGLYFAKIKVGDKSMHFPFTLLN